ncbi:hypothetical protein NLI96_g319 [Meripilus lineatus]|uniref:Uncharacterized protein n=1 Tax=Meripilus lineatus TaxID=2056292 RepID=A0AAD5YIM6_9APHY|nr:hypothetical protein NLI96_g319 [Physisporinus lineatus]
MSSFIKSLSHLQVRRRSLVPVAAKNQTMIAAAQNPPLEILLVVLKIITNGPYFSRPDQIPMQPTDLSIIRELVVVQSFIHAASLVCRGWNPAATELLYSKPILNTPARAQQFSLALRRSPSLGPLVKRLHVFVFVHGDSEKWVGNKKGNLAATLRACNKLEAFVLNPPPPDVTEFCPWGAKYILDTNLGSHLKELAIWEGHNGLLEILPQNVSLPLLEVLVLRHIVLPPDYEFPRLPKLHTLRLSSIKPYEQVIRIRSSTFPALRSLALQTWCIQVIIDPDCKAGLTSLALLGSAEMDILKGMERAASLENIKVLEIRVALANALDLEIPVVPPNLETIIFSASPTLAAELRRIALGRIYEGLFAEGKECNALRLVVLRCRAWDTLNPAEEDPIIVAIQGECESRGIQLEVQGEHSETFEEAIHQRLVVWPLNN